ncbi:MAG TPA: outer membrane protein assembly factor BamB [Chromatiaceae bacterium]|nr:outer membrane protein assembly factor BamB [Chromatiaceae bacterium]
MIRTLRAAFPVLALSLLLTGCSSLNPMNWFGEKSNLQPPSELTPVDNEIPVRQLWKFDIGKGTGKERLGLVPVLAGDKLFAASADGVIAAADARTGATVWRRETHDPISGGPGEGDGLLAYGTVEAEVVVLNEEDGVERWRTRVSSEVLSTPRVADGMVVVHTLDGNVIALDAESGKQRWLYAESVPVLSLRGSGSPAIADGIVYAGLANGKLIALDLSSGDLAWETVISYPRGRSELERIVDIDGDPFVYDGIVYVSTFNGELAAVSASSGVVLWRNKVSSGKSIAADWRYVYVTDSDSHVWALDPQNGASVWQQKKLARRRLSGPVIAEEHVVVGDFEGYLHWLAQEDGHIAARARVSSGAINATPIYRDGVLYVYADDGSVAAYGTAASSGE